MVDEAKATLPDAQRTLGMRQVLKEELVPILKELGFRGSMPHFYRFRGNRLSLLNFQFSSFGQYFFVNLGRLEVSARLKGSTSSQFRIANCPLDQRARLMSSSEGRASQTWQFSANTEERTDDLMLEVAKRLRQRINSSAEQWWAAKEVSSASGLISLI